MIGPPSGPAYGVSLRAVEENDTSFILSLRLDPALGRFLGDTSSDPEAQRSWIRAQRARPGDYYFVSEIGGVPVGTVGLYGLADGRGEWGRWVIARGVAAAPASVFLIYRFAFDELGLDGVISNTVAENRQVVAFHDRCGLRRSAVTPEVVLRGRAHPMVRHELEKGDWPEVGKRLAQAAAGAQHFLPGAR